MDNFPEFHRGLSRRSMGRHEDAIAAEVDFVIASSTFLAEKFARRGLAVEKVLNAFESTSRTAICKESSVESPVLGYLGCLGHWFDWPLVIRLAEAMPAARIELIGPVAAAPPKHLPAGVRILPPCRQTEVAGHLARFAAGLIPFQNNALTAGVDPIKFYEYRAAGLPVLSTSFGEMAIRGRDDGVYFLDRCARPCETGRRGDRSPRRRRPDGTLPARQRLGCPFSPGCLFTIVMARCTDVVRGLKNCMDRT